MAALCVILTVACGYDYRKKKIPNYLIVVAAFLGVGWRFYGEGWIGIPVYLGEMLCITCLMYPLFKIGAIGAGDVKLLGVTAGFLPFQKIFLFLFTSLLVAAVISILKLWKEKNYGERFRFLFRYLEETMRSGTWQLYLYDQMERYRLGICLSGPVLVSVLLYLGGVY
ncbi:MAG: prepilin peptidase [Acetatifactor sp.]